MIACYIIFWLSTEDENTVTRIMETTQASVEAPHFSIGMVMMLARCAVVAAMVVRPLISFEARCGGKGVSIAAVARLSTICVLLVHVIAMVYRSVRVSWSSKIRLEVLLSIVIPPYVLICATVANFTALTLGGGVVIPRRSGVCGIHLIEQWLCDRLDTRGSLPSQVPSQA